MTGRVQEGIYFRKGETPAPFFSIMFLQADRAVGARAIGDTVLGLWTLYQGLKQGNVPDLPGAPVLAEDLQVLLGFGPKTFSLEGAVRGRPEGLDDESLFASPLPGGGGSLLRGSGLSYAPEMRENRATEEVVVQFTGNSRLAVERGVVETWKHLHAIADPQTGAAPLGITTFYLGDQREDQRSWIDFHDGLSNLQSSERPAVVAIDPSGVPEEDWTVNGTYLAFARIGIDLAGWGSLTRHQQELVVGRDKLTGCPLTRSGPDGAPVVAAGCPVAGQDITDPHNPFRVAGQGGDAVIRRSHIQRANHHLEASDPGGLRIYRQGYPFLEWQEASPGFRAGLNFVSFQDTPSRVTRMLTQPGWLGGTNFGGDPAHDPPVLSTLLAVYAAGIYFVPPVNDDEPFPGAAIFGVVPALAPA